MRGVVFVGTILGWWASTATALRLQDDNVCKLVTFVPFTDLRPGLEQQSGGPPREGDEGDAEQQQPPVTESYYGFGQWPTHEALTKASYSFMAAAELARQEFNARSSAVVPYLAKELMGCPIVLETEKSPGESWYLDSAYDRTTTVEAFMDINRQGIEQSGGTAGAPPDSGGPPEGGGPPQNSGPGVDPLDNVCAVIAPQDHNANDGLSVLTEHRQIPQVAYTTIHEALNDVQLFPSFARVIPRAAHFATTVAKYLQRDIWQRDYVAILYDEDYGEQFEGPMERLEVPLGYETSSEGFVAGKQLSIQDAVAGIKERGFHTIVLITNRPTFLSTVARVAEEHELIGEEYFWIVSGDALPPAVLSTLEHPVDSPADRLLRGAAVFTNYDPFVYNGESDPFLEVWRSQDATLVDRVNALVPENPGDNSTAFFTAGPDYFQTETPTEYASFMYDAVMATGISACKAFSSGSRDPGGHYEQLLLSSFRGASGFVQFAFDEVEDMAENGRDPSGVLFGMYNVRPGEADENGMRGYEAVLTSIYSHENEFAGEDGRAEKGAWANVPDTTFVFYDQTENEPMPTRTVTNHHYLSESAQVAGICLMSIALAIAVFTGIWVFACRKTKAVQASQPEFLYLLCFGAALVAASLVFISFDESQGWSEKQLDFGCSAFPWFFVIGYLTMYSALFCKLWRLSKVLSMRRQTVDFKSVLKPFVIIMVICVGVLIFWQVTDPMQWEREVVSEDPLETYGECTNENGYTFFLILLGVLFFIIMGMTTYMAWKLKNVQSELSESKWVFIGILTNLEVWAIGIPIIIITEDVSREANYVMMAALVFIFSTSLVTLVIWPRLFAWAFPREPDKTMRFGAVSGGSTFVSGLDGGSTHSSGSRGSRFPSFQLRAEQRKVAQLEKEVAELKDQLLNQMPPESSLMAAGRMSSLSDLGSLPIMEEIPEVSENESEYSMSPVRSTPKPPVLPPPEEMESADLSLNLLESSDQSLDLLNPTDAEIGTKESSSSIEFASDSAPQRRLSAPEVETNLESSSSLDLGMSQPEVEEPKKAIRKRPPTPPPRGILKNRLPLDESDESLDFGSPGPPAEEQQDSEQSLDFFS